MGYGFWLSATTQTVEINVSEGLLERIVYLSALERVNPMCELGQPREVQSTPRWIAYEQERWACVWRAPGGEGQFPEDRSL